MLRVVLKFAGQSDEVVMALGDVFPEPPAGAGLVVVEAAGLVVDVAAVDFFPGLKIRYEMPNTTAATMTTVMIRRVFCLRLAAFCSASSRACRPAF